MKKLLKFFNFLNPYLIYKDLHLYFIIKNMYKQFELDSEWKNFRLLKGWFNSYGCAVIIDELNDSKDPEINRFLVKKRLQPIVDYMSNYSIDILNYINVKIKNTWDIKLYKVLFLPNYQIFRKNFFIKWLLVILGILGYIFLA